MGKSGGAKVIILALIENKTTFLITIYDKSEEDYILIKNF